MGCIQTQPSHDDSDSDDTSTEIKLTPMPPTPPPIPPATVSYNIALQSQSPTTITAEGSPPNITHMNSLSYRTKIIVYKPKIEPHRCRTINQANRSKTMKKHAHAHQTQKSKDDLTLYFDTKPSKRYSINQIDYIYDMECVTDIEDIDNDDDNDDDDNQTVILHNDNSLRMINYESEDTLTYHAYGGGNNNNDNTVLSNNNTNNSSTDTSDTVNIAAHDTDDRNSIFNMYNINFNDSNTTIHTIEEEEDGFDETSVEDEHEHQHEHEHDIQHIEERKQSIAIDKSAILQKILMNSKNIQNNAATMNKQVDKVSEVAYDMNVINEAIHNVTTENCIHKLETLGILTYVFVESDEFVRWNNRNNLQNVMDSGGDNREMYDTNPDKYIQMTNIIISDCKLLIKLSEKEKELFKTLILSAIQQSKSIYKINLNSANVTNSFLGKILDVLEHRIANNNCYGPELLFIDNNPISDRGIELICKYIKQNGSDLKHIDVGHCFANISTNLCLLFCQSLKCNESLLQITFDLKNAKHRKSVDESLKYNYSKYKQKQNNQIIVQQ